MENKYKTERTAILFVKKLQKLGISQGRIVQWNDIFEDSGIDVESFAKQVDKMSFLQKLSENKKESIAKLNQDIGQLGVKKSELLLQTKKLQSKRDELLDLQKIITKLLRNSAQDYRLVLQSSNNIVFNNLANTVTKELEQIITHTDKLLQLQNDLISYSKDLGRIELLSPIYKMISGSAVTKYKVLSILNTIINGMIVWTKKKKFQTHLLFIH